MQYSAQNKDYRVTSIYACLNNGNVISYSSKGKEVQSVSVLSCLHNAIPTQCLLTIATAILLPLYLILNFTKANKVYGSTVCYHLFTIAMSAIFIPNPTHILLPQVSFFSHSFAGISMQLRII